MRGELRPLVADLLSPEVLSARGLFDPESVRRLVQRNEQGEIDAAYTILSLMSIEVWCRKFLDSSS
jgi:asparagine synthase (glutamine-hydrolysing)